MKDNQGSKITIGQSVVVDGKRGIVQSIRNDDHFARVVFPDGDTIFAVEREIRIIRNGHHTKCVWEDCQGGCWDIFYEG
jgi:hypothetical protein